ncbi:hypothetical protein [Pseudoalteromonas sp. HM-SA03]|uniref:hypothetical protein n=1 Tax=Pseudoalteromonas sp. HM-SA03 TaxID=2029678 RepID=UPI001140A4D1|nr:hypothetical protein [Pseudoalteromonas sp. HM-SA03]
MKLEPLARGHAAFGKEKLRVAKRGNSKRGFGKATGLGTLIIFLSYRFRYIGNIKALSLRPLQT